MLKNLQLERPVAFIDVETTGTSLQLDRIVEISIYKIAPNGSKDYSSHRVNPQMPIPAEATAIHGITDIDVAEKPAFRQYANGICEFLDGSDISGFNVITFDLPFLRAEFERVGIGFSCENRQIVDSMVIYHQKEPLESGKPRDLKAAYLKYCGKKLESAHSAEMDATASAEILDGMLEVHEDLPIDIPGLSAFCKEIRKDYVDIEGKLIWVKGEITFNFGKYKGRQLKEIAAEHPDYMLWIVRESFHPDIQKIMKTALQDRKIY